ncbi:MAG: alpha-galactosidase [Lachnospiraceae bacterium]|nr:alpha-galactosidase [Lachnospiraceae bacterium]
MIRNFGTVWVLDTENTTYAFRILKSGHAEHLYYGASVRIESEEGAYALTEKSVFQPGNLIAYDKDNDSLCLENVRLEMSSYGKGDIREPFIEICDKKGSTTADFLFKSGEILSEKQPLNTLPSAYEEKSADAQELVIFLEEKYDRLTLELHYGVFEKRDVITRSARLINESDYPLKLKRLMSTQVDLMTNGYVMTTFTGAWAREMNKTETVLDAGKFVNSSFTGSSSNRANPFVMLSDAGATEDTGNVYGFNLIYSGNHYEAAEVNSFGKTRFVSGINPQGFEWRLAPDESFETPEAVMSFSDAGYNGLSRRMHDFVSNCIVRGNWKNRIRPILINSWEAGYFKIDEKNLLKLAEKAADAGIELFVMDDGWFGERNSDQTSLGDWTVNRKKIPGGLKGLADKINAMGMGFGLWVEPEMVNRNSELYSRHPEWAMTVPGRAHSEGRNQRILDLCNPEVVDHLEKSMTAVFSSANIAYVKWDMNRIFSDVYSKYLPKNRQGETAHRYILGLYELMGRLVRRFPKILFEGCASGGNRFDLGILSYFPQIWGSDNTDAVCRTRIQEGYSYGYPLNCVGAHVSSCPNHQTLRVTPLYTRFAAAAFCSLGYECNLADMSSSDLEKIKTQIGIYKQWREVLQSGTFYRVRSGRITEWTCVSKDRTKAVCYIMQELVKPNTVFEKLTPKGLDPDKKYRLLREGLQYDIRKFGDLINTAAPVHVKQDSLLHSTIARFVKMHGDTEDVTAYGSLMMNAGINLKQAFGATGYDENVRYFQDFEARLYCIEEVKDQ